MKQVITASDLERFGYCPMSWWLSVEGVSGEGDEIREGVERHSQIERGLDIIRREEQSSEEAERGLHGFTFISILLALIGVLMVYFGYYGIERSYNMGAIAIIIALIWLLAASFWFYRLTRVR